MSTASKKRAARVPNTPVNLDLARRALAWIHRPELGIFEIRVPRSWQDHQTGAIVRSRSLSGSMRGYYDNLDSAIADVSKIEGVSAYVLFNPAIYSIKGRSYNRISQSQRGESTKDTEIAAVVRIYLDIDSVRPEGVSAIDAEVAAALECQQIILDNHPELADAAHWGCSGNGAWVAIDCLSLPPSEAAPLTKHMLTTLACFYCDVTKGADNPRVKIGVECYNPSRIGCLPGTWKCKGDPLPEQPWRMVTMDSPDRPTAPIDLVAWLEANPLEIPSGNQVAVPALTGGNGCHVHDNIPADSEDRRVEAYVQSAHDREMDKLSSATPGSRNNTLNDVAFAIGQLTGAKLLDRGRMAAELLAMALQIGLDQSEAQATIQSGLDSGERDPRRIPPPDPTRSNRLVKLPDITTPVEFDTNLNGDGHYDQKPKKGSRLTMAERHGRVRTDGVIEAIDDPHRLSRMYIKERCMHENDLTIRFYRDAWMRWTGNHYEPVTQREVNAHLNKTAKAEFDRLNKIDFKDWMNSGRKKDGKTVPPPEAHKAGTRLTGDMNVAMTSMTMLDGSINTPAWLDGRTDPDPAEIMPCKNSLIHLPSYADGKEHSFDLTPKFFNTYSLSYDFNPDAETPHLWIKFLHDLWKDDADSIRTLQEWFGYCLTGDTKYQKILALLGPKRSGKDTIRRVLSSMIGECNCAGPTLSGLATNFGIAPLIGKPLAIVQDARLSPRVDAAIILERLLTISGEGALTIDRKGISAWTGKLPTRLMIVSNILPRFDDSSGALAGRLIVLKLMESFYGREDLTLFNRLVPKELPGILLWAIEGWRRLRDRGRFVQPGSSSDLAEEMDDLGSPVRIFVRERCVVGEGFSVPIRTLYDQWRYWCSDTGRKEPGDVQNFGRNLMSFLPTLKIERPRTNEGDRVRCYLGINLQEEFIHTPEKSKIDMSGLDTNPPF